VIRLQAGQLRNKGSTLCQKKFLSFPKHPEWSWDPHRVSWALYPVVKQPGAWDWPLTPASSGVRNQ
jgi:hypothetical protein